MVWLSVWYGIWYMYIWYYEEDCDLKSKIYLNDTNTNGAKLKVYLVHNKHYLIYDNHNNVW